MEENVAIPPLLLFEWRSTENGPIVVRCNDGIEDGGFRLSKTTFSLVSAHELDSAHRDHILFEESQSQR